MPSPRVPPPASSRPVRAVKAAETEDEMLMPSESQIEVVGAFEVANPVGLAAIAAFRLREALTKRQLARDGLTVGEAIERALRCK